MSNQPPQRPTVTASPRRPRQFDTPLALLRNTSTPPTIAESFWVSSPTTMHIRRLVACAAAVAALAYSVVPMSRPASALGQWSSVFSMLLVAVHAALMRSSDLLLFDAWKIPGTPLPNGAGVGTTDATFSMPRRRSGAHCPT